MKKFDDEADKELESVKTSKGATRETALEAEVKALKSKLSNERKEHQALLDAINREFDETFAKLQ